MNPTSTDAMKASLSEAGGHLKQAASHAGEAIKGMAAAAGVSTQGRSYSGALEDSFESGRSAFTSLPCRIRKRSSAIVSPTMAKSRSHFSKIARASASRSGFSTISMRSCDSDSIIS